MRSTDEMMKLVGTANRSPQAGWKGWESGRGSKDEEEGLGKEGLQLGGERKEEGDEEVTGYQPVISSCEVMRDHGDG